MKKFFYIILLIQLTYNLVYAGNVPWGIELNGQAKYNFIENSEQKHNYGGSLLFSYYINRLQVQTGLGLQSKNFTKTIQYNNDYIPAHYRINYFSLIPITINVPLGSFDKFEMYICGGLMIHHIFKYTINSKTDNTVLAKNPDAGQHSSSSVRIGTVVFSKRNLLNFKIITFAEYKILVDSYQDFSMGHFPQPNSFITIPQDRFSIGIALGWEFCFSDAHGKGNKTD